MAMLKVSIGQIKAARALLGWSQGRLALESGVSIPTVKRLEAGTGELGGRQATVDLMVGALTRGGVIFIEPDTLGPGVRLRAVATEGLKITDSPKYDRFVENADGGPLIVDLTSATGPKFDISDYLDPDDTKETAG